MIRNGVSTYSSRCAFSRIKEAVDEALASGFPHFVVHSTHTISQRGVSQG